MAPMAFSGVHTMLSSIPNEVNIADDILIGGSVEEHDAALQKFLSALTNNGITVNPDKCFFDIEEVRSLISELAGYSFYGYQK